MSNTTTAQVLQRLLKSLFMKKFLAAIGLALFVCCFTPAFSQDSSRLNTMDNKVDRSQRREARAQKKLDRQQHRTERKQKKLDRRQKKTDRQERKRNREERKLERSQEKKDSTAPSQVAFYRKENVDESLAA